MSDAQTSRVTRDEFLERLRASRLLTADQLAQAAGRCDGDGSATALADALRDDGVLTPFQARRLLSGSPGPLVLGQYQLLDELGQGGMGHVFKARHTVMGRAVALKVLSSSLESQSVARGWFDREVRTLTQLQHPNIVLAYDANEVDGVRFLVMEYVEGENLHNFVRSRGPLTIDLACAMMAQAAAALQYAHEKGLVHRDIKPANLLVPADGEPQQQGPLVKIVDFGLARLRTPAAADTIVLESPEHFAGTPDYCSPEQCCDVHAVDIRSDLYSLGCTFYFALTGRPPFGGHSLTEKLAHHLMEPPPPVTHVRADVPDEVEAILLRLMAKHREDRFQTPADLAAALRPWCEAGSASMRALVLDDLALQYTQAPRTAVSPPRSGPTGAAQALADDGREPSPAQAALQDPARVAASSKPAQPSPGPVQAAGGPDMRLLRDGWRRWTDLVAGLRDGREARDWDEAQYRRLYEGLLAGCRRGATMPPDRATVFRQLDDVLRPWVSLQSLRRTEPELLTSLLARSTQAEKALGVRRSGRRLGAMLRTYAAPALVVWLIIEGGMAAWRLAGAGSLDPHALLSSLRLDTLPGQLYLMLPILALAAILIVRK